MTEHEVTLSLRNRKALAYYWIYKTASGNVPADRMTHQIMTAIEMELDASKTRAVAKAKKELEHMDGELEEYTDLQSRQRVTRIRVSK